MRHPNAVRALTAPRALFLASALTLTACGGGGGGAAGTDVTGGPAPANVTETLNALGVDTTHTDRVDTDGNMLDGSYSPLGSKLEIAPKMEMVVLGSFLGFDEEIHRLFVMDDATELAMEPEEPYLFSEENVLDMYGLYDGTLPDPHASDPLGSNEPYHPNGKAPQTLRHVAALDLDGSGIDEIVMALVTDDGIDVRIMGDELVSYAATLETLPVEAGIEEIALAGADLDGDGDDELLMAWAVDGVHVVLTAYEHGPTGLVEVLSRTFEPELFGSEFTLCLEGGNVDNDHMEEIGLLIDENADPLGNARVLVLDDLRADWAVLRDASFRAVVDGTEYSAVVADLAFGDVDGDRRDELVLGGMTYFTHGCEKPPVLLQILEDAESDFEEISATRYDSEIGLNGGSSPCPGGLVRMTRWVHVLTGDLDDDGVDEVCANEKVFDDWKHAAEPWTELGTLPGDVFFRLVNYQEYFDRSTSAFAVGDFTGDGRDDYVTWAQPYSDGRVFEYTGGHLRLKGTIHMKGGSVGSNGLMDPFIVLANVDTDTPVLQYAEAEYRFVFTEPVVIAALAAPPYQLGIGQNVEACSTAFGSTTTTGQETERSMTVSSSSSIEFSEGFDLFGIVEAGADLKKSVDTELTRTYSNAYELSRTVIFHSGYDEDVVVFSTVPMDIYDYTVKWHPNPELVGRRIQVRLPRKPVIVQASRTYYNAHVFEGGMKVEENVFRHRIGDLSSYPTVAERDAIRLAHPGTLYTSSHLVPQGTGATEHELSIGTALSSSEELGISYETEVRVSGGANLFGFKVGGGASTTDSHGTSQALTITSGHQTSYTGIVGALSAETYALNRYWYGLMAYKQIDPETDRSFHVVNYWVE